jgi:hypothetical protein
LSKPSLFAGYQSLLTSSILLAIQFRVRLLNQATWKQEAAIRNDMHLQISIFLLYISGVLLPLGSVSPIAHPSEITADIVTTVQVETGEDSFYFDLLSHSFNHPGGSLDLVGYYDPNEVEINDFYLNYSELPSGVSAEVISTEAGVIRIRLTANEPIVIPELGIGSGILTVLVDLTLHEQGGPNDSRGHNFTHPIHPGVLPPCETARQAGPFSNDHLTTLATDL